MIVPQLLSSGRARKLINPGSVPLSYTAKFQKMSNSFPRAWDVTAGNGPNGLQNPLDPTRWLKGESLSFDADCRLTDLHDSSLHRFEGREGFLLFFLVDARINYSRSRTESWQTLSAKNLASLSWVVCDPIDI